LSIFHVAFPFFRVERSRATQVTHPWWALYSHLVFWVATATATPIWREKSKAAKQTPSRNEAVVKLAVAFYMSYHANDFVVDS